MPRALRKRSRIRGRIRDPIANARLRGNEVAELALLVQRGDLAPDLRYVDVKVVAFRGVFEAPYGPQQPAAGHDATGVGQQ
jgi:hypothetical protein